VQNWDEFHGLSVDCTDPKMLEFKKHSSPHAIHIEPGKLERAGQLGIWFSVLNALAVAHEYPIVTFEDDALLHANFVPEFFDRIKQLPDDADFFALFIPRDSDHLYDNETMSVSAKLCRAYQNYGGVSMYYTPQGARKIMRLLDRDGLHEQYDNQLFDYVKAGELNGYTSKPYFPDLVYITGQEASIVQESEIIHEGSQD
jgi:hypothetical protein